MSEFANEAEEATDVKDEIQSDGEVEIETVIENKKPVSMAAPPDDLDDDNDFYKDERVTLPKPRVPGILRASQGKGKKGRALSKNPDRINPEDPDQTDYIKQGSDTHAQLLGLMPVSKETKRIRKEKGMQELEWELIDTTLYGVSATGRYLETVLLQKISELTTPPVEVQSDYPYDEGYAPKIWLPKNAVDPQGNLVTHKTKGIV